MPQHITIDNKDGRGFVDMTKFMYSLGQLEHNKNQPALFDFSLTEIPDLAGWSIPGRGAYVRVTDDFVESRHSQIPDGIIFTGYVTDEPAFQFLGKRPGANEEVFGYVVRCASDDFLLQIKRLPVKTYINKSRGFILADLARSMFSAAFPMPFDLSGIATGGIEQVYQVDTNKKWSEIAADFAAVDGFTYWARDHFIFYGPEEIVTLSSDPQYLLSIDLQDPRYTSDQLSLQRVSRDVTNDLTVLGEDEPTDLVTEYFISNGFSGFHELMFEPFGLEEEILVNDDLTGDEIDSSKWVEKDGTITDVDDFIVPFEGSLNIKGGPGIAGGDSATVHLISRRPIELSGFIDFRDGEIFFPQGEVSPGVRKARGRGMIGAISREAVPTLGAVWTAWWLDLEFSPPAIFPYDQKLDAGDVGYGIQGNNLLPLFVDADNNIPRHYVLRRFLTVDRSIRCASAFTASSTGTIFGGGTLTEETVATMTWVVDEIIDDDPEHVYTVSHVLMTKQYSSEDPISIHRPPPFVLYAPTVPRDCHYVTNFIDVSRPAQARVTINSRPAKVGSFLDGGRCAITADRGRSRLAWYSTPAGATVSYSENVLASNPIGYWRLGEEPHPAIFADSSITGHKDGVNSGAVGGQVGALSSDDDGASFFSGTLAAVTFPIFPTPTTITVEAWVKSTNHSTLTQPILNNRASGGGINFGVASGVLYVLTNTLITGTAKVDDGAWHHVAWTNTGTTSKLYVDGVLDLTFPQTNVAFTITTDTPPVVPAGLIGGAYQIETTIGEVTQSFFTGDLDEVALYDHVLDEKTLVAHYRLGRASNSEIVTIPPAGARVSVQYFRKQQARSRVLSTESVLSERARFGDDGVRQHTIRPGDAHPAPRTSEECLLLAQAYMIDNHAVRYEGSYNFDSVAFTQTHLLFWPIPGDWIPVNVTLPAGDSIHDFLVVESVAAQLTGNDAYTFTIKFGPINRFDIAQRQLLMRRQTSLEDPVIKDEEADTLETLVTTPVAHPDPLTDVKVIDITATQFTLQIGTGDASPSLPTGVAGYDIRTDDTGWGIPPGTGKEPVKRVPPWDVGTPKSITLDRIRRDQFYFIRPFTADSVYALKSAVIRIVYPLPNNIVLEIDDDSTINGTVIRIIINVPNDPGLLGIIVRKGSETGAMIYQGNGVDHLFKPPAPTGASGGVEVTPISGAYVIDITPGPAVASIAATLPTSFVVAANSYNLLNMFGTWVTGTINFTPVAPAVTTHPSSQSVAASALVTFTSAASGAPTPSVQWQVSTDGGGSWSNIGGATASPYSFIASLGDDGHLFHAVWTNASGTATSTDATLTVT